MCPVNRSIAHVGAFKRFSEADQGRTVFAVAAVMKYDREFIKERRENDIINLCYGRDFLTETFKYDMVILHSILFRRYEYLQNVTDRELLTSPHNDIEHWRARLTDTDAKFIVVCEYLPATLSGWNLGQLDGYERLEIDAKIAVYRKL
jgi:hypothetical protein